LYQKVVLDNGLRIVTANMPHTQSVCVSIFVSTGSRYETDAQAGISHFIEHLCFRGTAKRKTSRDVSEAIEGVGGILNGGTDKEITIYWCKVAQKHFPLAVDVLSDMVLNSRLDPQDMEKERQVIVEEINMSLDSPAQRVDMLIDELIWPHHPMGRDIAGTRESVTGITREALLDYMQVQYAPAMAVVAIAGNVEHEEAVAMVRKALGSWSVRQQRQEFLPFIDHKAEKLGVERRDTEQAHLCLALPGISLFHPDRFTLDLLSGILGEGMSSRLFTEIRDRLGLAYSVHSCVEHFLDTGSITVSASVEPRKLPVAMSAILEQIARLKDGVPELELTKAKEMAKGRLILRMEDSRSVAGWMGGQEVLTGDILSVDDVVSRIEAITAGDIQKLAQGLLVGEYLKLAVVGPVENDGSLEKLLTI
jgi:predicted Zn-dependent peptidase